MSRTIPFDPLAICDVCGATGAFDFMGDLVCASCTDLADEPSDEDDLEYEDVDDEDRDLDYAVPNNG